MLNCHGTITEENYEQALADTRLYGPKRVAAAKAILKALEPRTSEFQIFLESGTLLGAYRNGKMLPHDDDFDYGLYVPDEESTVPLLESLKAHLVATLPKKYQARIVDTYSKKVEVYEPEFGNYPFLENTVYHNVTVDITAFVDDGKGALRMPHYRYDWFRTKRENLLPLSTITYEGETFPAPRNPEQVLVDMYGYIGEGAVYDPATKKYVAKESTPVN
jgi:hypothetical protein